ncbi:hypothetical protein D3C76_1171650 [compost metagenome]
MALAGESAIRRKLLNWPKGTALKGCQLLFSEWLQTMGDGSAEDRQIFNGISEFIALHSDSRFSDIYAEHANLTVRDRAGYYQVEADKRLYLFNLPGLKEAASGFSQARIVRALLGVEALVQMDSEDHRWTKRRRTPGGGNSRFYVIDPDKLEKES